MVLKNKRVKAKPAVKQGRKAMGLADSKQQDSRAATLFINVRGLINESD